MCGRFTQLYTWPELVALYRIHDQPAPNLAPRYNIAPTQEIDIVTASPDGPRLVRARWGLVPGWWKKPMKELPATFNARAETVAEKPMFRSAFRSRRCIVPASGYYEWTGPKEARQPYYISAADGAPLSLAGLWESFRDPDTGEEGLSAAIIVCPANPFMAKIHDRMPVILDADTVDYWLAQPELGLLRPLRRDRLQAWKVHPRMNSSRYSKADAADPLVA